MYGKHFESMYTGSMVGIGAIPFAVWGYIISHQRPPRFEVELNPKLLAVMIGESPEDIAKAIEMFCKPDLESRTDTMEGRKLERIGTFLFRVVNGAIYDGIRSNEERKEYWREQKRKARQGIGDKKTEEKPKIIGQIISPAATDPEAIDLPPKVRPVSTGPTALDIYDAYPRKIARPDALRSIAKALKKITPEKLLELTKKYADARIGEPEQYTPHPATWFNAERFNDNPATWKNNAPVGKPNPRNFGIVRETEYAGAKPRQSRSQGEAGKVAGEVVAHADHPPAASIGTGTGV